MKLKHSGSVSDSDYLNSFDFSKSTDDEGSILNKSTDVQIITFATSPIKPSNYDSELLDKDKDKDKFKRIDVALAVHSLPKIIISIGGVLLTGSLLNIIIVRSSLTPGLYSI